MDKLENAYFQLVKGKLYPGKIVDGKLVRDTDKALEADLAKYNPDQERDSHGRFGSGGGATGGNGLNHREIYNLQINRSDPQKQAVY